MLSAAEIRDSQQVPLSTRSVQRILASSTTLVYTKRKSQPRLEPHHKEARVVWAEERISWTTQWRTVIFSDEKKFNLDGPDGCQYYWQDLRREPQYFSKRVQGGGSLMIWAAFSYQGKTKLAIMRGRQDSAAYQQVLQEYLVPCTRILGLNRGLFQQDNAPIHSSASTTTWFTNKGIHLLPWPSRSPDLNPIENIWGYLVRRVYASGKQYQSVTELEAAVQGAWDSITVAELHKLVNSMPKRLVGVLKANGGTIRY
jgi:hypothetical protein